MPNDIRPPDKGSRPIPTPRPRFRFAPDTGGTRSWIDIASGYFMLNGVLNAVLLIGMGVSLFTDPALAPFRHWRVIPWIVFQVVAAVGLFWTGLLIGRRLKLGGFTALAFTALQFLPMLFGERRWDVIIWPVLTVIVLKVIWRDLA